MVVGIFIKFYIRELCYNVKTLQFLFLLKSSSNGYVHAVLCTEVRNHQTSVFSTFFDYNNCCDYQC